MFSLVKTFTYVWLSENCDKTRCGFFKSRLAIPISPLAWPLPSTIAENKPLRFIIMKRIQLNCGNTIQKIKGLLKRCYGRLACKYKLHPEMQHWLYDPRSGFIPNICIFYFKKRQLQSYQIEYNWNEKSEKKD